MIHTVGNHLSAPALTHQVKHLRCSLPVTFALCRCDLIRRMSPRRVCRAISPVFDFTAHSECQGAEIPSAAIVSHPDLYRSND